MLFPKGGFHVAIQSGIPIVPVVIHNSSDISPKGDKIFRSGTVKVDILPAINTSDWSVGNIDEHVTHVRNLFLKTLGQPELSVEETVAIGRRDTPEDLSTEVRGQRKSKSFKTALTERSQKKRSRDIGGELLPEGRWRRYLSSTTIPRHLPQGIKWARQPHCKITWHKRRGPGTLIRSSSYWTPIGLSKGKS